MPPLLGSQPNIRSLSGCNPIVQPVTEPLTVGVPVKEALETLSSILKPWVVVPLKLILKDCGPITRAFLVAVEPAPYMASGMVTADILVIVAAVTAHASPLDAIRHTKPTAKQIARCTFFKFMTFPSMKYRCPNGADCRPLSQPLP